MSQISELRPSPIAGQWYPGDPKRLAQSVDRFLDDAQLPDLDGELLALVAPHAGHLYSGAVAGYAFALLRGQRPDVVALLSPMHAPYYEPLLTSAHQAYQTPLGRVDLDLPALQQLDLLLKEQLGFGLAWVANDSEHSIEIQLPFLQRALAQPFTILPIMLRDQSLHTARGLGIALASLIRSDPLLKDKQVRLVASTDLSHFYPQETAEKLDAAMLEALADFDPEGVIRAEEQGRGFACGRGALAAVLFAARELGADRVQVLRHATSGDVSGDYSRVVGYGAAAVLRGRD